MNGNDDFLRGAIQGNTICRHRIAWIGCLLSPERRVALLHPFSIFMGTLPDFGDVTIFISSYLCTNIVLLLLYTFVSEGIIGLGQIKFFTATVTDLPNRNTKRQTHIFQIYHCLVCWKSHFGRRILRRRQMPPKSWFTSLVERYMECVARWNEFELTI